jgi:ADP-heptose:LPS heptosyltransferase
VRTDNLGDVLMTTPALQALKSRRGIHLTLLTSPAGAAAAAHLPFVDDVIAIKAPWVKLGEAPDALGSIVERVREGCFDAGIVFTTYSQSALPAATVLQLAGVPLRLAHCRENPYALLTDWVPDPEPAMQRHEVLRQLSLLARIGVAGGSTRLRFTLRRNDAEHARHLLRDAGIAPTRPYLLVHPGASAPSRRYPPERFGAALEAIGRESALPAVVVGAASERDAVDTVVRHAGATQTLALTDDLSLGELAALIADAAVVICNNSGPAHLAAALRTPVVVLYALTNLQHMPWGVPARVLYQDVPCRNCLKSTCPRGHHACLLGVAPTQVAAAALDLLASPARSVRPGSFLQARMSA